LFENKKPLNIAMAHCGAKPYSLNGDTLYMALTIVIKTAAMNIFLFNFIKSILAKIGAYLV
jgi:hypothetical protein